MNTHHFSLVASLMLAVSGRATAQTVVVPAANQAAAPFNAANAVGHWLHDPQGNVIGNVRALADGGRIAVIMVGPYFGLGSHEARFPVRALSLVGRKVTLQAETVEALDVRLRWWWRLRPGGVGVGRPHPARGRDSALTET